MNLNMKKRIIGLLGTVSEYLVILDRLKNPNNTIRECLTALNSINEKLMLEEICPDGILEMLTNILKSLKELQKKSFIDTNKVTVLHEQMLSLKTMIIEKIDAKLNIVFFPYKVSMWDSLESVYEAAVKDKNCTVRVVPIPYYRVSGNGEVLSTYEGDRFPHHIHITHFDEYSFENERPDIVFVHNIYDNYNTLTRVDERFFTSNIKKYTDMLVYIPYHISSFILPKPGDTRLAYSLATIKNVDRIILAADFLKVAAINEGVPAEKLLVLGSPKFDAMLRALHEDTCCNTEWKDKLQGKIVYLINTGCLYFSEDPFKSLEKLVDLFNISRMDEKNVVIWRPHPLTKTSIAKYTPYFADYYKQLTEDCLNNEKNPLYENIIFDESDNYFAALKAADVLISTEGSLLRSYLLTEKKILYWDEKLPGESAVPSDTFYYVYDSREPWYKLVKRFSQGDDPLADKRKGIASKAYVNVDGSSGLNIFNTIKESLFI